MAEYRISVYGRKQSEWDQLASWFVNNALYSKNAVWLIQVVCCSVCYSCSISLSFSLMLGLMISQWALVVTHRGLNDKFCPLLFCLSYVLDLFSEAWLLVKRWNTVLVRVLTWYPYGTPFFSHYSVARKICGYLIFSCSPLSFTFFLGWSFKFYFFPIGHLCYIMFALLVFLTSSIKKSTCDILILR